MRRIVLAAAMAACLAGCSESREPARGELAQGVDDAPENQFGFMEARETGPLDAIMAPEPPPVVQRATTVDIEEPQEPGSSDLTVPPQMPEGAPQIAYTYDYGFRIANGDLNALEQRHADLCVSKGPQVCRIISMEQSGSSGEYGYGHLSIQVVADQARAFGSELATAANDAGGEQVSSSIRGEDLSKQIVDTEARLRARTLLRDRLMEVLATRRGTVAELVEAERGVAQVNEEIDQARSWLAEMRGRVAFSDIDISYESGNCSTGGFWSPISYSLGSFGSAIGTTLGVLIMLVAWLLPWVAILALGLWAWRKWVRPRRLRAKAEAAAMAAAEAAPADPPAQ